MFLWQRSDDGNALIFSRKRSEKSIGHLRTGGAHVEASTAGSWIFWMPGGIQNMRSAKASRRFPTSLMSDANAQPLQSLFLHLNRAGGGCKNMLICHLAVHSNY